MMIKKKLAILIAVLFLISACKITQPADQTPELTATENAAYSEASSTQDKETMRQTKVPSSAPASSPALETPVPVSAAPSERETFTSVPSVLPTPAQTVAPVSEEELNSGALDSFFDDSVLVGDSMTDGFSHFVMSKREKEGVCLGNMKCIGQSGLFLKNAYNTERGKRDPVLSYRGRYYSVSDLVRAVGAKVFYLLLGVNDIYANDSTVEDYLSYFDEILRNTQEKSPEVQIVLITIPPAMKAYAKGYGHESTDNLNVNKALYQYCEDNGFGIVELADRVRGKDGYLDQVYCSDKKFHLNKEGNEQWLAAMREYARMQYETGKWKPKTDTGF